MKMIELNCQSPTLCGDHDGPCTVLYYRGAITSNMISRNKGKSFACSGKFGNLKIFILCLVCMSVYIYLYSAVSMQTSKIQDIMNGTLQDLQKWKYAVQGWMDSLRNSARYNDPELTTVLYISQQGNGTQVQKNTKTQVKRIIDTSKKKTSGLPIGNAQKPKETRTDKPLLTLFTTWPTKADKFGCHNNTLRNWMSLKPLVEPILFTTEEDLANRARQKGWRVLPVSKTGKGIPVLKNMFLDAMNNSESHFYGYGNGDILFTDSLTKTLKGVLQSSVSLSTPMMIIGQRTNVQEVSEKEASSWNSIASVAKSRGKLFTTYAEDYFITMKNYPWQEIPDVVIGRRAYDNWLLLNARKRGFTTIDITKSALAVHQTTKAGNYEGHQHKDREYNHNLLVKLYRRINYGAGLTSCAGHQTRLDKNGSLIIEKRNVHRSCFPV